MITHHLTVLIHAHAILFYTITISILCTAMLLLSLLVDEIVTGRFTDCRHCSSNALRLSHQLLPVNATW